MKLNRWIYAWTLVAALGVLAAPVLADSVETTTANFVITSPEYGDAEFEIENPEVGEVNVFWTDTGEKVTVTYDEEGFLIEMGEKQMRVATSMGGHHLPDGASGFVFTSEDEHEIVIDGNAASGSAMVWHSDGEGDGDGEKRIHVIKKGTSVKVDGDFDEEGVTEMILPDGADLKVVRTKDDDGKVKVKILRDGEEIDPTELGGGDHGQHVVRVHKVGGDGTEADGQHVVKIRKVQKEGDSGFGDGTQIQVQIQRTIEDDE